MFNWLTSIALGNNVGKVMVCFLCVSLFVFFSSFIFFPFFFLFPFPTWYLLVVCLQEKQGQEIKLAQGKPNCALLQWFHIFLIRNKIISNSNLFPVIRIREFVMQGGFIMWCCACPMSSNKLVAMDCIFWGWAYFHITGIIFSLFLKNGRPLEMYKSIFQ